MLIVTTEELLDLLEEPYPYLCFCQGGVAGADKTVGKVEFVLKAAGRHVIEFDDSEGLP